MQSNQSENLLIGNRFPCEQIVDWFDCVTCAEPITWTQTCASPNHHKVM